MYFMVAETPDCAIYRRVLFLCFSIIKKNQRNILDETKIFTRLVEKNENKQTMENTKLYTHLQATKLMSERQRKINTIKH